MRPMITVLIVVMTTGCQRPAAGGSGNADVAGPVEVIVSSPVRQLLKREVEQPGQIEPYAQTPIYAKVAGYVSDVRVDIGDRVKGPKRGANGEVIDPGTVLARLWVPELDEELKQKHDLVRQIDEEIKQSEQTLAVAEAALKNAASQVDTAIAGRGRAVAEVTRWASQRDREEDLVKRRVIDQQALEETRSQLEAAKATKEEVEAKVRSANAARDEAEAQRDRAKADVKVATARRAVAEADRRRVAALVNYTTVTAPFDGVVSRRNVDVGHFLQPASAGEKGESLFVVTCTDTVRVCIDVQESDAGWVKNGAKVKVRVQALHGREFPGTVTRSSWSLDPRTRSLRTVIDLKNPEGLLRVGMYAYAVIAVEHPDVLTLPATAVVTQDDKTFCYRVVNGKSVKTPIRVGASGGGIVEVLSGVTENDVVVKEKATTLSDGQAVKTP